MAGRVSVTGDFDRLARLVDKIDDPSEAFDQDGSKIAATVRQQYREGFDQGRSPYGGVWAPRKEAKGGRTLVKTGATRNASVVYLKSSNAVRINSTPWARYHQFGTSRMNNRAMMPYEQASSWDEPISRTLLDAFARFFGAD